MSHQAKWEYFKAIYERYRKAARKLKHVILNEFCLNTHHNRKYAIRLLNGPPPARRRQPTLCPHPCTYSAQVVSVLTAIWKAAGYPWSVRLKALLPVWMPWVRRRFHLSPKIEQQLLHISPRQIDRRLRAQKLQLQRRIYGRTKPGTLLKHQITIKTEHWDVKVPGFTEVDLVSHSGNSASGEFAHSLNVTDIHTGWTETRAILGRSRAAVLQAFEEIKAALPFRLLGIDSDNGSEFINWHLGAWCDQHDILFTRGRPYKKDDNAHIEQKNWTHVRKLLGWDRYDSSPAVEAINDLYRHELRLWLNLYLPSVKLVRKVRKGSKLRRVYDAAQTPLQRALASEIADKTAVDSLQPLLDRLDPFALDEAINRKLQGIYALANRRWSPSAKSQSPSIGRQPGPRTDL
jgi:transposase InsO family protein